MIGARRVEWSEQAENVLAPALLNDAEYIKQEVKTGVSALYELPGRGYFVTRLEQFDDDRELVIVACSGVRMYPVMLYAKKIVDAGEVDSVRLHTRNRRLQNIMPFYDFTERERVFEYGR